MAKSRREEKVEEKEGDYQFQLPAFDEKAFIRREVESARSSFYSLGLGVVAGIASTGLQAAGLDWKLGWLPILIAMVALQPLLKARGFGEDATKLKAIAGGAFMLFFTALSVWVIGVNLV